MAYDPYSMAALEGGSLPMTGGGGGAMSGAAGAAGGFGIVASAAMGGGPWQGISDFLGGFNSSSKLRRHIEAAAPRNYLSGSINKFLNEAGLNSYKTSGKGSTLHGHDAFKNKNELDKIIQAVKEKYPGYTQWQYAEMFKDVNRFMPSISIDDAIESRKQELLNPETDPAWTTPEQMKKKHGKGLMNAQWTNKQLLANAAMMARNPNYNPKELRAEKGSNLASKYKTRRTDITIKDFIDNIYKSINDNTFLPEWARQTTPIPDATLTGGDPRLTDAGQYTPEMPTVQDPEPTPEPGLITEPEPTPTETPTEPPTETPSDQGLFEFNQENIDKLLASEPVSTALQRAQATQADADATPSDKNNAWKTALGVAVGTAGLSFGLSKLFQPRNGETTDGDINNLPRLNLNLPSSNRLGLNFSNTGGLTPVPPPALATLPTGVQSVRGIVPEFKYKDDYVGYPLL
jgi:hypothetical protein